MERVRLLLWAYLDAPDRFQGVALLQAIQATMLARMCSELAGILAIDARLQQQLREFCGIHPLPAVSLCTSETNTPLLISPPTRTED